MSIIVKTDSNQDYYKIPPGTYVGRCFSVIDLGTYNTEFGGEKRERHEVRISWEVPDEIIERDGQSKPATISKTFTHSLHEKSALRHTLESWRGRTFTDQELQGFDLAKLLGAACTLTISEVNNEGKSRAVVSAVGKLGKGMKCGEQVNKSLEYSVALGKDGTYAGFPDWLKKKLDSCLEWNRPAADVQTVDEQIQPEGGDPDVPF